jgi:hypothetical protein
MENNDIAIWCGLLVFFFMYAIIPSCRLAAYLKKLLVGNPSSAVSFGLAGSVALAAATVR